MSTTFKYQLNKLKGILKSRIVYSENRNWTLDAILALGKIYLYVENTEEAEDVELSSARLLMDRLYKELIKIHRNTELREENLDREIRINEFGHIIEESNHSIRIKREPRNSGRGEDKAETSLQPKRMGRPPSNRRSRTKRYK